MVLEATMIVVDNSESSRNGDYVPSRWEAQADAVNLIFSAKTQANPESSVGLMNMAGKGPEMLVTLTTDFGKVLDGMHRTKIRGNTHLATAIQIAGVRSLSVTTPLLSLDVHGELTIFYRFAQLALKHRQNKSQRQRIIVFTCSPIGEDRKDLIILAKKMKKIGVSIDFIAFGDLDPSNTSKLEAFNENIKGGDGSHLEIIHPGPSLLSDHLLSTPILAGDGVGPRGGGEDVGTDAGGGGGGAGNGGFEFGVDPSTDPELALALRMSMEEEKVRQEKEKPAAAPTLETVTEEGAASGSKETEPLLGAADGEGSGPVDAAVRKPDEGEKDKDHEDTMDTS